MQVLRRHYALTVLLICSLTVNRMSQLKSNTFLFSLSVFKIVLGSLATLEDAHAACISVIKK